MVHSTEDEISRQISDAVDELRSAEGLPFKHLLDMEAIKAALDKAGVVFRDRVYNPAVTIWAFLSQVLSEDQSCSEAVDRVNAQRVADGLPAASSETTSYCEARNRLPVEVVRDLAQGTARDMEQQADPSWLWKGRHVKIADGTTVIMPDTEVNQQAFPQPSTQKPGLGFPMARLLVIFSLACGTVLEMVLGRCEGKKTGENSLFRSILETFVPGDICLGDCLFDCYRDIADLRARGVDCLFRMNASRHYDFRRGTCLGYEDHLVTWTKPKFDSSRFDRATYDALPSEMPMREIRFQVMQPGFRSREIRLVTTLLDPVAYPLNDIVALYRERWHCELDLRSLKAVMQMGHLRCMTPERVIKEIWMHILAYNLVRKEIAEAAAKYELQPRRLSFKGAKQVLATYTPRLATSNLQRSAHIHSEMLRAIAQKQVGDRPDRVEPRQLKKRKKYKYMTKPRAQLKAEATAG